MCNHCKKYYFRYFNSHIIYAYPPQKKPIIFESKTISCCDKNIRKGPSYDSSKYDELKQKCK